MQIHTYTKHGDITGVERELASGVDIDSLDKDFQTPLMHAVSSPKAAIDMVSFLIKRGANVNAIVKDKFERPVLSFAVKSGNLDKIILLLDSGANVKYKRPKDYDVLIDASYTNNEDNLFAVTKLLLERGAQPNTISSHGESAIRHASVNLKLDVVKLLLDAGVQLKHLSWTELMYAVAFGSLQEVEKLLRKKDTDLSAKDHYDRTAWLMSLHFGELEKAKLLLAAGANRKDRGRCQKTPIQFAVTGGHSKVLEWLMAEGFDVNAVDKFKDTALMTAAEMGYPECIEILLKAGVKVDQGNDTKETALMKAAESGSVECAEILIKAGADVNKTNKWDHTAISMATSIEMVRFLVSKGAQLGEIRDDIRWLIIKVERSERLSVSKEEYLTGKDRQFGKTNPELMDIAFWRDMVKTNFSAYGARATFEENNFCGGSAVWCSQRFGRSLTELPDGRIIEIAGEHEDASDPDFCIYNDVIVYDGKGDFKIYGYPKEVFRPTDFHSATLVGNYIYIIGNLGYMDKRIIGKTQVYRLDCNTLKMEKVETTGEKPGWISKHKAHLLTPSTIYITGGKLDTKENYINNKDHYILDLETMIWKKVTKQLLNL